MAQKKQSKEQFKKSEKTFCLGFTQPVVDLTKTIPSDGGLFLHFILKNQIPTFETNLFFLKHHTFAYDVNSERSFDVF